MDMTLSQVLVFLALLLVGWLGLWLGKRRPSNRELDEELDESRRVHEEHESGAAIAQREHAAGELHAPRLAAAIRSESGTEGAAVLNALGDDQGNRGQVATDDAHTNAVTGAEAKANTGQTRSLLDVELARGSDELKRIVEVNQVARTQQREAHPLDDKAEQAPAVSRLDDTVNAQSARSAEVIATAVRGDAVPGSVRGRTTEAPGVQPGQTVSAAGENLITAEHLEYERQNHHAQRRTLEARLSTVEKERDQALRERDQQIGAVRDRDATIVTLRDEAAHVVDLQDKLAQAELVRTEELDERRRIEEQLRGAHLEVLERLEQEQEQQLAQQARLESRLTSAERERDQARRERDELIESVRADEASMLTLKEEAVRSTESRKALAEAEIALATASSEHERREEQLEEQLRRAEADASSRVQEAEQRVSELEQHIVTLESSAQSVQQDADSLHRVSAELEATRIRVNELSSSLSEAEARAAKAGSTDLELRRVRSELAALESERASAANRAASIEQNEPYSEAHDSGAHEQSDSARLAELESELQGRNQRIVELEQRLVEASREPEPAPKRAPKSAPKVEASTPTPSAPAAQSSERRTRAPLFTPPHERDDLKMIKGIGPVMEQILNELGITSFQQITAFTQDDISRVAAEINTFPGRIERDDWIGGARREYEKKYRESAHS